MAKCANCGATLGCGCQKRTLTNGTIGCVNCAGKTLSNTVKTNTRTKITPTPANGYHDLKKFINK